MKVQALSLQQSLTTVYDQTKTTLQGRIGRRSVTDGNGAKTVLGTNPVLAIDVFDDTGVTPTTIHASTANGRIFIGKGYASNVWTLSYYLLTVTNGVATCAWQGDLKFTNGAAAATYTPKGLVVDDSNPASMTFSWVNTHTTVTNGGLFACFGVNVTDFVKVSVTTFPVATLANQTKAVYMMGDNAAQASQALTIADGIGYDHTGKIGYVLNGAAATPSVFKFDLSAAPTSVPAANGYDSTRFLLKTGTLAAFSGVIQLNNNVQFINPFHTSNAGSNCLSFITTTNIYVFKVSDIAAAVTTLPSLVTSNTNLSGDYLASGNLSLGQYFASIDKWVCVTANGAILIKQCVNNDPNGKYFGGNTQIKTELGGTISIVDFGLGTGVALTDCNGFAVLTSSAVGQRDGLIMDVMSDSANVNPSTGEKYCSLISKVMSINVAQGAYLAIYKEFAKRSVYPNVQYRTSNFGVGPGVGFDATWTTAPIDGDLSLLVNVTQVQFRITFTIIGMNTTNSSQINEAYVLYTDPNEISDNWAGSVDNTTANSASPAYSAFRLQKAYATSVPTIYFMAYDDSNNLVTSANTAANPTLFEYSTNNGTSWNALGTIPNTIGTTEVRYKWATPPGVRVTVSLREQ